MVKALFDSDILIDLLSGAPQAADEIRKYSDIAISVVSWIEVLVGAQPADIDATKAFLARFDRVDLTESVAEAAAELRREKRLKLPDAVIWASARAQGRLLVTRNSRDFPADDPGVRIPYRLS